MSQPEPILQHMPDHIKKKIMDSSNTNSKLSLRQCSKSFNSRFAESWTHYEYLDLDWNFNQNHVRIHFIICGENKKDVIFHEYSDEYLMEYPENHKRVVKTGNFIDAAVEQFMKIFKKRNVVLNYLAINYYKRDNFQEERFEREKKELIDKLIDHMASLGHTIHVKRFAMHTDPNASDISRILPFFEPETLQRIEISPQLSHFVRFHSGPIDGDFNLSSIIGMEQWKRARELMARDYRLNLGHEETKHFDECSYVGKLDLESFKTILENLHLHSNWTYRSINWCDYDYVAISRYLSDNALVVQPCRNTDVYIDFIIPDLCTVWITTLGVIIRNI